MPIEQSANSTRHEPTVLHMQVATRILKYLAGTAEKGIKHSRQGNSRIISYSDFANDPDSRLSVSGASSILAGAAITPLGLNISTSSFTIILRI